MCVPRLSLPANHTGHHRRRLRNTARHARCRRLGPAVLRSLVARRRCPRLKQPAPRPALSRRLQRHPPADRSAPDRAMWLPRAPSPSTRNFFFILSTMSSPNNGLAAQEPFHFTGMRPFSLFVGRMRSSPWLVCDVPDGSRHTSGATASPPDGAIAPPPSFIDKTRPSRARGALADGPLASAAGDDAAASAPKARVGTLLRVPCFSASRITLVHDWPASRVRRPRPPPATTSCVSVRRPFAF